MLYLNQALDLLHQGCIRTDVGVLQRRAALNGVLLLGQVRKHGTSDAFPHHSNGPTGALHAQRGSYHSIPANLAPTSMGTSIFVLTMPVTRSGERGREADRVDAGALRSPREGGGVGRGAGGALGT